MRFSILTAVAALGSVAVAQMKATVVVENINLLTVNSQNIIEPTKQLSILNAPQLVLGAGPWSKVIFGLADIVSTATGSIADMSVGSKVTYVGDEATAIADAFHAFVKVHQLLLDALIGKGGFITSIPFVGPPVAAVLRSIESVVDALAFGIIDTVEDTVAAAMRTEYADLEVKIEAAITVYSLYS